MKKAGLLILASILLLPIAMVILFSGETTTTATTAGSYLSAVPNQYLDDINKAGAICPEITPSIIAAQIDAESGWNPNAGSPAGARGIAQFMPGTWTSRGMDGDGDGTADILNAHDAIWSQGNLMCDNITAVNALIKNGTLTGDPLSLALSAYNAGLGNVKKYGGIPPFTETQTYVKKIKTLAETTYAPEGITVAAGSGSTAPLEWAKTQTGKYYCGAGRGPLCFDCCGLVGVAIENTIGKSVPMSIPGNTWATSKCENAILQRAAEYGGVQVPLEDVQPGDIMFFQDKSISPSSDYITHVAFYAGNGQITHAENAGVGTFPLSRYASTMDTLPTVVRIGGTK